MIVSAAQTTPTRSPAANIERPRGELSARGTRRVVVERRSSPRKSRLSTVALPLTFLLACQAEPPEPPPCDDACTDGIALRSVRETMKLVYNLTLQGNDVGEQDET